MAVGDQVIGQGEWVYLNGNSHWYPWVRAKITEETGSNVKILIEGWIYAGLGDGIDYDDAVVRNQLSLYSSVEGYKRSQEIRTVQIHSNQGWIYNNDTPVTSYTVTISKQSTPIIFKGYLETSGSGLYQGLSSTATTEDLLISPISTYTITYNGNATGVSRIPSQQIKNHDQSINLRTTIPVRTGYTFKGWATSANSTVVKYAPGSSYSNNADLNLYAVWTIMTFTVTFNPNGGLWSGPATQTKEYGTTLTLTSVKPTRTGYSFVRWGTNSDGSGVQYQSGGSYNKNEDAILYALWRTTINYNANGGTGEMAPSNTFSSVNLRWNSFTRIGYKFIGWNTKADGTGISYDDGATYSGESVTLYAQWKEIPWIDSITYQKEEDGVSQQIKFFIGTTFDRVYDTVARGFSLQDLAIALKRFFKKQAFMIYAGNKPADYSKVMEWYAISGDTSDLEVDPALVVIDSDV